ncbi:UNVERIFIED_CONTAM: Cysteine protease RD19A [Sesamum calycinum]|uniref:Cysteine protease RD19A n=1 Tax=Sesamum calycinum TaxID=2727403 RepID=A0AAW2PK89_9LAMI
MASRFLPLFLSSLLIATSFGCSIADANVAEGVVGSDDALIRQVVDHGDDEVVDENSLLNADHHFAIFKRKFGKSYASQEEHDYRLSVFKANLHLARRHQKLDPSAVHGVTQFSDLTPREFRQQFLGVNRRVLVDHAGRLAQQEHWKAPTSWRRENFVTQKKGSCDSGCNGGLMNSALEYTLKAGGLMREEDYPYTGTDHGTCKFEKTKIAAKVANFSVVPIDEEQIAANLVKNGPLAVAINAVYMQTYIGGVSCPLICSKRLDHGVLLVGYGEAGYAPIRRKEKPYWIIKNSWGENGEKMGTIKSVEAAIFVEWTLWFQLLQLLLRQSRI